MDSCQNSEVSFLKSIIARLAAWYVCTFSLAKFGHVWLPSIIILCTHELTGVGDVMCGNEHYRVQFKENLVTSKGFDILSTLKVVEFFLQGIKIWNNLHSSWIPLFYLGELSNDLKTMSSMRITLFSRFMVFLPHLMPLLKSFHLKVVVWIYDGSLRFHIPNEWEIMISLVIPFGDISKGESLKQIPSPTSCTCT